MICYWQTVEVRLHFFIGCWRRGHGRSFFARGHALGAVFNQLVRSRAQLLLFESLFVPTEQDKKPGD